MTSLKRKPQLYNGNQDDRLTDLSFIISPSIVNTVFSYLFIFASTMAAAEMVYLAFDSPYPSLEMYQPKGLVHSSTDSTVVNVYELS